MEGGGADRRTAETAPSCKRASLARGCAAIEATTSSPSVMLRTCAMFANVRECSRMFENVRECSKIFESVRECSRMSVNVRRYSRGVIQNVVYFRTL